VCYSFLRKGSEVFMSYIITATDSAGALSLKRDSAAAAIKKALELIEGECREVCITAQMAASTHMLNLTNFTRPRRRNAPNEALEPADCGRLHFTSRRPMLVNAG
jgi:hypothetical protein